MGYLVEPMIGIGAYKLGMTLEQIQNLLPNGYRTAKNRANSISEIMKTTIKIWIVAAIIFGISILVFFGAIIIVML